MAAAQRTALALVPSLMRRATKTRSFRPGWTLPLQRANAPATRPPRTMNRPRPAIAPPPRVQLAPTNVAPGATLPPIRARTAQLLRGQAPPVRIAGARVEPAARAPTAAPLLHRTAPVHPLPLRPLLAVGPHPLLPLVRTRRALLARPLRFHRLRHPHRGPSAGRTRGFASATRLALVTAARPLTQLLPFHCAASMPTPPTPLYVPSRT